MPGPFHDEVIDQTVSLVCLHARSSGLRRLNHTRLCMTGPARITIVNVGHRPTNYWVVSAGRTRLLVDLGYPGTMGAMRASLDRMGVPLNELRYGLATHYHIDHAGLAQEIKQAGVPLLVLEAPVTAMRGSRRISGERSKIVSSVT